MNRIIGLGRTTLFLALVAGWLTAVANVAMAQEQSANAVETTTGPAYLMPYSVVVITIGVTIFLVVRPSRRRAKAQAGEFTPVVHGLRPDSKGPPAVSLGMNIDQVIALLGKPKVSRKGSEIYADLAQQGKLSEEDARKEYLIFQHPAGRYDLVVYERKIIQIRAQPQQKSAE